MKIEERAKKRVTIEVTYVSGVKRKMSRKIDVRLLTSVHERGEERERERGGGGAHAK